MHKEKTTSNRMKQIITKENIVIPRFRITETVKIKVQSFIGEHLAERGGMIGRDPDNRIITHFIADHSARTNAAAYDPDIPAMNEVIKSWKKSGIEFCGFIHSHPHGVRHPSGYDIWYAGEILSVFKKLDYMWMPIVQTTMNSGKYELLPYVAIPISDDRKHVRILPCGTPVVLTMARQITEQASVISDVIARKHNEVKESILQKPDRDNSLMHGPEKNRMNDSRQIRIDIASEEMDKKQVVIKGAEKTLVNKSPSPVGKKVASGVYSKNGKITGIENETQDRERKTKGEWIDVKA